MLTSNTPPHDQQVIYNSGSETLQTSQGELSYNNTFYICLGREGILLRLAQSLQTLRLIFVIIIADYKALLWILAASQVAVVIILIGLVFTVMVIICMSWKR